MRMILIGGLLALWSLTVAAAAPSSADYQALISASWPQAHLRADQQQWLAKQSVRAYEACRQQGADAQVCGQTVLNGLREVLGSEPQVTAYSVRW